MENKNNKSTTELQDEFDPIADAAAEQSAEAVEISEDMAEESHEDDIISDENADKSAKKVCRPEGITIGDRNHGFLYRLFYESGVLYFLLSFIIPVAVMLYAFKDQGIHPFGDKQMLVVDLWHQYFPFFRVVREKLLTGGSFLYSWQNGMGTNFLSLISYYAASPLNWLSIFFSDDNVRDALTYILIAKIGFCGAFFSCFLRYTFKRKDISICIFSSMFALCSYMLGYYWNVMWFDTIALFPLVMLGIVALAREGKWKTYTFSLALSLITNYYIGFFTCIFTIFMFAAYAIIEWGGFKQFFGRIWLIVRSSVLGIALGGFILLPAYYALQLTYSVNNVFPTEIAYDHPWTEIFANTISYSEPAMKDGLPNFACGMLAIILLGVFLFSAGIKIREKVSAVLLLGLIAVSCNMNVLNFIWHGFHVTNMIPYRFAFIFPFILVAAAYRAYDVILRNGIKIYQIIAMLIFPAVVFYLNYVVASGTEEGFSFKTEKISHSLIITGAMLLIFLAVKIFPFSNKKAANTVLSLCLGAAVIAECCSNAVIGVKTVGNSDYPSYLAENDRVQVLLDYADSQEPSPLYRTEMTKTWTLNDSSLYGYFGISQFSSSANLSVTKFIQKLGLYASEAGNRYYYRVSTPVVNSLLGIKYLINKSGMYNGDPMGLSATESEDNAYLYKNKYPLSIGYMVSSDILDMDNSGGLSPFDYQEKLMQTLSGTTETLFTPQPVALAQYNGVTVTKNGYGSYSFTKDAADATGCSILYTFNNVEGEYLYGYLTNGGITNAKVTADAGDVDSYISVDDYPIVFPMGGTSEKGESVVTLNTKDDANTGNYTFKVYSLNKEAFENAYNKLADEQLEITEFEDTDIKGRINALEDGVMMLTIPYEKGWSVYIDGEEAETYALMDAMTGVKVSAGEHDIRIRYIPEGFIPGTTATGVSAVLCVGIAVLDIRKKKKKSAVKANSSEAGDDPDIENTESETAEQVQAEYVVEDAGSEDISESESKEETGSEEETTAQSDENENAES